MSDTTGSSEHPDQQGGSQPPHETPPQVAGQQQPGPYGQQYGQSPPAPGQSPYAQSPYGQSPYGQPYGGHGQDHPGPGRRPTTVTVAGILTLVFSGVTLVLFALGMMALGVARSEMVDQLQGEPGLENVDPNDLVSVMLVVFVVFIVWCIAAMLLAVFAMRRSNGARIGLVVSSAVVAGLSLLGITSGLSVVTLAAAVAVIVCLFAGGASQWYAGGSGSPTQPHQSGPIA